MRQLKRILILVIAMLCVAVSAYAVRLDEIGREITVPEDFVNLLAEDENANALFEIYQIDKDTFVQTCNASGIIYDAINADLSKEMAISIIDNATTQTVGNLSSYNPFDEFLEEYKSQVETEDYRFVSSEKYEQGELTFIHSVLESTQTEGITIHQYYTIVNGKAITISVTYYDSNYEEQELVSMVQSIQFDQIEKMPNEDINFYVIAGTVGVLVGAGIVYLIYKLAKRKTTPKEEDL